MVRLWQQEAGAERLVMLWLELRNAGSLLGEFVIMPPQAGARKSNLQGLTRVPLCLWDMEAR
ncbi:MAG: hypothetical protein P8X95_20820 [Anaerolineales bacterium]